MSTQQPIAKIGTKLVLSGHDITIERICSEGVTCRLASGLEVFAPLEQIEKALAKKSEDNGSEIS